MPPPGRKAGATILPLLVGLLAATSNLAAVRVEAMPRQLFCWSVMKARWRTTARGVVDGCFAREGWRSARTRSRSTGLRGRGEHELLGKPASHRGGGDGCCAVRKWAQVNEMEKQFVFFFNGRKCPFYTFR